MELVLTEEQRELQRVTRAVLADHWTTSEVRALKREPVPASVEPLAKALADAGLLGMSMPREVGGSGEHRYFTALMLEEAGRVLAPLILAESLVFAAAVERMGTPEQRDEHLGPVLRGERRAVLAVWDPSDARAARPARVHAERRGSHWRLSGSLGVVTHPGLADRVLAAVEADDGLPSRSPMLVVLRPGAPGWHERRSTTISGDEHAAVTLDGLAVEEADVLGADIAGKPALGEHVDWLASLAVAEQAIAMAGGALAVLDRTVAHVREREQFGRPLGAFQAVQHHVADMRIRVDAALLAAHQACWWVAEGHTARREVAIAKLQASEAYTHATLTAHQLHGGMGYVRETDLHLWSERAKLEQVRLGGPEVALGWLAAEMA